MHCRLRWPQQVTAGHCSTNGVTHTDTHHSPSPDVEPLARFAHVDYVASEVERIGSFIDDIDIWSRVKHVADSAKRAREVHRAGIGVETNCHLLNILLLTLSDALIHSACG